MEIPAQALLIKKIYDNSYDYLVKNPGIKDSHDIVTKAKELNIPDLRKKYGLTMNEIMFLLYLDKHEKKNSAREIIDDLMTTKSHISKSIDSLAKENIIIRIPDEYDKKIIRLFINNKADNILNDLRQREKEITKVITKDISEEDKATFKKVLEQMQNCSDLLKQNKN